MTSLTDSLSNFVAGGPTAVRRSAAIVDWQALDVALEAARREASDCTARRAAALELASRFCPAEYAACLERTSEGEWRCAQERGATPDRLIPLRLSAVATAHTMAAGVRSQHARLDNQRHILFSQVPAAEGAAVYLAAVVGEGTNLALAGAVLRLVGLDLAAESLPATKEQETDSRVSAAVLGLTVRLAAAADAAAGAKLLADLVRQHLGVERTAVAFVRQPRMKVELAAYSDVERIDRQTDTARLVEECLTQSLSQSRLASWSSAERGSQPPGLRSWPQLAAQWKTGELTALRVTDRDNKAVAVCLLAGSQGIDPQGECFLTLVGQIAGPLLRALERGTLRQWLNACRNKLPAWLTPWRACGLAAVAVTPLLYPWPSKVTCSVVLEPKAQRLIAAPFEGVFNRSFVLPGDKVEAGQVLGEMEGREVRSRLAALEADAARSSKSRDSNLAAGKFAAAQIDKLQMQRLEHERSVLEERLKKLEIRSPIAGIVVSGDLRRNEGAAVKVGQALYEVAPLESVIAEIAVPEEDLEGVAGGAAVVLRLDSAAGQSWQGKVERIHPRGELRENRQVFIAETSLTNESGELRPGMKGTASITGPRAPGIWLLVRKPFNTARRFLGW